MESLEEKLIKNASNSELDINNEEKEAKEIYKREEEIADALKKLKNIRYFINSYIDINDNIIGGYGLDVIEKSAGFYRK